MKKLLCCLTLLCFIYSTGLSQISIENKVKSGTVKTNNLKPLKTTDLSVTISSITYANGAYSIKYSLKNEGQTAIDLKQVTMQATVLKQDGSLIGGGGGTTLIQAGILNAGNEYNGVMTYSTSKLYKNNSYIYKLKADEFNTIAEINENNNTADYPIVGYTDPVMSATTTIMTTNAIPLKPDLTITGGAMQRNADGTYTVYYTLKNTGEGILRANYNGVRLRGEILDGTHSYYNSYKVAMATGTVLSPGESFSGNYITPVFNERPLINGQQYEYYLTIDFIEDILETNETNNKFRINFRLGY